MSKFMWVNPAPVPGLGFAWSRVCARQQWKLVFFFWGGVFQIYQAKNRGVARLSAVRVAKKPWVTHQHVGTNGWSTLPFALVGQVRDFAS